MKSPKMFILCISVIIFSVAAQFPTNGQSDHETWASYIAFDARHWTGTYEIHMVNAITGQIHLLTVSTEDSIIPAWSVDGTRIAFTRYSAVYVLPADNSARLQPVNAYADTNIAWLPDNNGFATNTGMTDLTAGASQEWQMYSHPGYNLDWSPSGQFLVYDPPIRMESDEQSQVWDRASGEAAPTFQTEGIINSCCAMWSPDGKTIALLIGTETAEQLIVIEPGGETYRVLAQLDRPEMGTSFPLAWSPGGLYIAYVNAQGSLHTVNLRGIANPRLVAQHVTYDRYGKRAFDWSPDGTQLTYISNSLYVVNRDGSEPRRLVTGGTIHSLDWQPAQLHSGGKARVMVLDTEGLKMRSGPGISFEVVGYLANGTIVDIIAGPEQNENYRWWRVRAADGQEGWSVQSADGIVTLLPQPAVFANLIYTGETTPLPATFMTGTPSAVPTETAVPIFPTGTVTVSP